MTQYLYQQLVSVYGQKAHETDIPSRFFVSEFSTIKEYVEHEVAEIKKDAGEYWRDSLDDAGGLSDDGDYRGLDGYARAREHVDNIRLIGEVTDDELAVLQKFGAY